MCLRLLFPSGWGTLWKPESLDSSLQPTWDTFLSHLHGRRENALAHQFSPFQLCQTTRKENQIVKNQELNFAKNGISSKLRENDCEGNQGLWDAKAWSPLCRPIALAKITVVVFRETQGSIYAWGSWTKWFYKNTDPLKRPIFCSESWFSYL